MVSLHALPVLLLLAVPPSPVGGSEPLEIDAPLAGGRIDLVGGDPSRSSVRLRFEACRLAVVAGVVNVANGFRMSVDIRARRGAAVVPPP
jgi:hypothetical protein